MVIVFSLLAFLIRRLVVLRNGGQEVVVTEEGSSGRVKRDAAGAEGDVGEDTADGDCKMDLQGIFH